MQDSTAAPSFQAATKPSHQLPDPEQKLRCPRCDSTNTKFCYYNNYNLSQPRHFCKSCRRYWTKGGALRNVPVGGGTRKSSKRANSSAAAASAPSSKRSNPPKPAPPQSELPKADPFSALYAPLDAGHQLLDVTGSFSSLLPPSGHFGCLLNSFLSEGGAAIGMPNSSNNVSSSSLVGHGMDLQSSTANSGYESMAVTLSTENFLGLQADSECWDGAWSDLSIYNPGSNFQ